MRNLEFIERVEDFNYNKDMFLGEEGSQFFRTLKVVKTSIYKKPIGKHYVVDFEDEYGELLRWITRKKPSLKVGNVLGVEATLKTYSDTKPLFAFITDVKY